MILRREDFLKVIRLCTKIEWSAADEFSRTAISTWQDYWENKFVAGNDEKTVAPESLSIENEVSKRLALADAEYAVYKEGKPSFSQFGDHYDLDIALRLNSDAAATKMALLDRILKKAKTIADEKNVEVAVLIQPSSRDLTQNVSMNNNDLQQYPEYRRDRLTSIVDDVCSRYQMHRVNLYPIFFNNSPRTLFFKENDDHWNDAGQELAARQTADYIYNNILSEVR